VWRILRQVRYLSYAKNLQPAGITPSTPIPNTCHLDLGVQQRIIANINAVGLHLLHGLVLAALGRHDEALEELTRELACADSE
jgi:hypothetical protein